MTDTAIESGLFALDPSESRVIRGLLLPFGEQSRVSISGADPVEFAKGTVTLPRDPSVVTLNRDHDRFDPIGRAVEITEKEDGIHAAFAVAETDEGDAYLAEYANGGRKALSAEIASLVRRGAKAIAGRLSGAAVVPEGAFAGAHLFAVGEVVEAEEETTDPAPAESTETGDEPDEPKEESMPEAVAPVTLGAGTPQVVAVEPVTKGELFAAIAANAKFGTPIPEKLKDAGELFAFGTATGSQGNVIPAPQVLGELWDGIGFTPKYSPLVAHGDLSALSVKGWKFGVKPTVSTWAGDGAQVDGSAVTTVPLTANATRLAGGNKIPREYVDFGETQFIDSLLRLLAEDYARDVDAAVGTALVAGATALASAATTALAMIVDGAIAVVNAEDTPSFALVNPADFATIANTKHSDQLAYIEISIDWGNGTMGGLRVVPSSLVTTGASLQVLVASKNALRLFELPGSPIRVDAAAIQNGSTDHAVFGYYATLVEKPTSIQLVS